MENKSEIKMTFRIVGIELSEIKLIPPGSSEQLSNEFSFNIAMQAGVNQSEKKVVVTVIIDTQNMEKTIDFAKVAVNLIFEIDNFDEVIEVQQNKAIIPNDIIEILNSVSYSTMRGIMWNELKGTFLHHAILPIIDPKQISPQKIPKK